MKIADVTIRQNLFEKSNVRKIAELKREDYGQEAIIDLHDVDKDLFDTKIIRKFVEELCDSINMRRGPIYVWGNDKSLGTMHNPKADGISCVQFLYSSSISIHALDELRKIYINIFSCENFDAEKVKEFTLETFGGNIVAFRNIKRR